MGKRLWELDLLDDLADDDRCAVLDRSDLGGGANGTSKQSKMSTYKKYVGGINAYNVKSFGVVGDGVTDDTTAMQSALDTYSFIYIPEGTYICSNLIITNKVNITGDGNNSSIKFKTGSTGYLITASVAFTINNIDLDGNDNTDKNATVSAGTRSGLYLSQIPDGTNINNFSVHGFTNIGIGLNGDSSTRSEAPNFSNISSYYNFTGIDTGVGAVAGGEYIKLNNITCHRNRTGIIINSGNVVIGSSHFNDNGIGVNITGAYNNAHGSIVGSTINHNTVNSFLVEDVTNGFSITACNIFFGDFSLDNSKGLIISSCVLNSITMDFTTGGLTIMSNCWFQGTPVINSSSNLILNNNYIATTMTPIS